MDVSKNESLPSIDQSLKDKILHILSVYPIISPSMMQISIGSTLPAAYWKQAWSRLLEEGAVKEDIIVHLSPSGRNQSHTLYSLKDTPAFPVK